MSLKMSQSLLAWVARAAIFIVMILQYISFASYASTLGKSKWLVYFSSSLHPIVTRCVQ